MHQIQDIQNFIINEIDKLSNQFPFMSFRYGFDKMGIQHIINVEPSSEFKNEAYMNAELSFQCAFIELFPAEDLLFVSNDKYIQLERVIYVRNRVTEIISNQFTFHLESLISSPIVKWDSETLKAYPIQNPSVLYNTDYFEHWVTEYFKIKGAAYKDVRFDNNDDQPMLAA
jgi:hypothetical protein